MARDGQDNEATTAAELIAELGIEGLDHAASMLIK